MRVLFLFLLMSGIVFARPPDPHAKKTQPTVPVHTETTTLPTKQPAVPAKPSNTVPETSSQLEAITSEAPPLPSKDALRSSLPEKATNGIRLQWFGHAFIYLTSANGIRVAIDPFTPGTVKYDFPPNLAADVALVSCENEDRTGTEELFGTPLLFRSVTGQGVHSSNGLLFRGIESWRDAPKSGTNTIYTFTMDTIRFCALGNLGYPLNTEQKQQTGKADILFVSVGNRLLRPKDFAKLVDEMKVKWIVPVAYLTSKNNTMDLRALEEFDLSAYPVEKVTGNSFVFQKDRLPSQPTVLMLESP